MTFSFGSVTRPFTSEEIVNFTRNGAFTCRCGLPTSMVASNVSSSKATLRCYLAGQSWKLWRSRSTMMTTPTPLMDRLGNQSPQATRRSTWSSWTLALTPSTLEPSPSLTWWPPTPLTLSTTTTSRTPRPTTSTTTSSTPTDHLQNTFSTPMTPNSMTAPHRTNKTIPTTTPPMMRKTTTQWRRWSPTSWSAASKPIWLAQTTARGTWWSKSFELMTVTSFSSGKSMLALAIFLKLWEGKVTMSRLLTSTMDGISPKQVIAELYSNFTTSRCPTSFG